MKITEIEWVEGYKYTDGFNFWTVENDELVDESGIDIHYSYTLKDTVEAEFIRLKI